MTPERLREIAERHAEKERINGSPLSHRNALLRDHNDRGELLVFIQRIAEAECYVGQAAVGDCFYCGVSLIHDEAHTPDCPSPALEAYKETTRTT